MFQSFRDASYGSLLALHGAWRWLVLALALVAVVNALLGSRRGAAPVRQTTASRMLTFSVDIQLLLGLALYLFASPLIRSGFSGESDWEVSYFLVIHLVAMLAIVVLVHAGNVAVKKARTPVLAARRAAALFSPALLILLVAMPWWRPALRI